MSYHFPTLTPSPETRADGWSPARQRRFLETLEIEIEDVPFDGSGLEEIKRSMGTNV